MKKSLVAYFSASGITAEVARNLAAALGCEEYKIVPVQPYTDADLDWTNGNARSSVEMRDYNCRPALMDINANIENYDVIFLGFPIWWYREPSVVDTFLESYDFSGKLIIPFCTSGGSGISDISIRISELTGRKAVVDEGKRFSVHTSADELKSWAEKFV